MPYRYEIGLIRGFEARLYGNMGSRFLRICVMIPFCLTSWNFWVFETLLIVDIRVIWIGDPYPSLHGTPLATFCMILTN